MIEALYRFLKSLGYPHPIHAPIAHMPIGLVTGALVFFLVAIIFKRKQLILTARHASILALIFAFPTILFGVFDWIHFYGGVLFPVIVYKMILAGVVLVLLGLGIILGGEVKIRTWAMTLIYVFSFIAVVGLGYFGGNLVFGTGDLAAPSPRIGVAEPSSPPPAVAAGGTADGKTVFQDNCASCHPGGDNIVDPKFPVKGSKKLASLDAFTAFVRNPVMPDGKAGPMPPFDADALNSAQVQAIYSYATANFKK